MGGRLLASVRDFPPPTKALCQPPPPSRSGPKAPTGGGGGRESRLGGGGGVGGAIWVGSGGGGAQAPLTSPCPPSYHTISQLSVVVLQIWPKFWWMLPMGVRDNHTKYEPETQRWRPGTSIASARPPFQNQQFRAKISLFFFA